MHKGTERGNHTFALNSQTRMFKERFKGIYILAINFVLKKETDLGSLNQAFYPIEKNLPIFLLALVRARRGRRESLHDPVSGPFSSARARYRYYLYQDNAKRRKKRSAS